MFRVPYLSFSFLIPEVLYLQENDLEGTIPTTIGRLDHLKSFRLYKNQFEGTVPVGVCNLVDHYGLEFLAADCADEGGTIQCSCCHECHH